MRAQRVREGESRVEMQIVKWTAEGTGKSRYSAKCTGHSVNQGGTAGEFYCSSLTEMRFCHGRAFFFEKNIRCEMTPTSAFLN